MKITKILSCTFIVLGIFLSNQSFASDAIPYKGIRNNQKIGISSDGQTWSNKCTKDGTCYKRTVLYNGEQGSVYYAKKEDKSFATNCIYEFIKDGKLIGYSNFDLNFYNFILDTDGTINGQPLSYEEVAALFSDYKIIKLSDFSPVTNSLKIQKGKNPLKIILYNDKNIDFDFYNYGTYTAKYTTYPLKGFLKVNKAGMIHFSHYGDNTKDNPLYVLLVR